MKKFKVSGFFIDRIHFSLVYEIDEAQFSDHDEVIDYVTELSSDDARHFDVSEWDSDGSEDAGDSGFTIDEINQLPQANFSALIIGVIFE